MPAHNIGSGLRFLAFSRQENLTEVHVEVDVDAGLALLLALAVELLYRHADVCRGDIDLARVDDRLDVRDGARHTLHVAELLHRGPALVLTAPSRARRQPHGKRL